MAAPGSYGSTTAAPAASNATPTPPTGSFPSTPSGEGLGVNGIQVANLSVTQFLSDYGISSSEENTYLNNDNGKLSLNENALMLMQYKAMDEAQRQTVQQSMVNAGVLSPGEATGTDTSAGISAFKSAITTAATTGTDVNTYLQNYSGTNFAESELSGAISNTEKEAAAPTTATVENPSTLSATITNAFNQALGYSPNESQINSFISQIQGQDTANAEAPHQAAEDQLAQLRSDQSALSKMGPNDIDSIITAYTNAIHGVNTAAGNPANQQGVPTGSAPSPQYFTPGTALPAGVNAGFNNAGSEMLANTMPVVGNKQEQVPNPNGVGAFSPTRIVPGFGGSIPTKTVNEPTVTSTPGMAVAPNLPAGLPGTKPTYGGMYALTPGDWAEAQKLNPQLAAQAKKNNWTAAGQAPVNVQHSALTSLLSDAYDNNGGSWADAIIQIAGGTPGKAGSEAVAGSKTNLQTFATGVANNVEQQLTQLQNNIATQSVTVKTAEPDASAEASAAAKESDPVGYYAANAATGGSILNEMLAGAPQMFGNSTADTFTGPVPTDEAASAPAPVAAA